MPVIPQLSIESVGRGRKGEGRREIKIMR